MNTWYYMMLGKSEYSPPICCISENLISFSELDTDRILYELLVFLTNLPTAILSVKIVFGGLRLTTQ